MRTIKTEKYYTSMENLLDVFEKESRRNGFIPSDEEDYLKWKKNLRSVLLDITGISKMEKCDLEPQITESVDFDGYRRDKVLIKTQDKVIMPFYVFVPEDMKKNEKRPCMIAPHGHGSAGKYSPSGRRDIPAVEDAINKYNYDYAIRFVQEGYIAFAHDARGFGERRESTGQGESEEKFMNSTCIQLNHMAISLGLSLTGMWTWDIMRLIDYIYTREDCDNERIGCGGLSGGGLQTLWAAALDDRIKCAVISGYFYGYRDSLLKLSGNCGCNYVPDLWRHADMGDIGALIAPRALLIETGSKDPLNGERGLKNVYEQLDITGRAYDIFNKRDYLFHHVFDGEHLWNGEKTYDFLKKYL